MKKLLSLLLLAGLIAGQTTTIPTESSSDTQVKKSRLFLQTMYVKYKKISLAAGLSFFVASGLALVAAVPVTKFAVIGYQKGWLSAGDTAVWACVASGAIAGALYCAYNGWKYFSLGIDGLTKAKKELADAKKDLTQAEVKEVEAEVEKSGDQVIEFCISAREARERFEEQKARALSLQTSQRQ